MITNQLLYQLSYTGIGAEVGVQPQTKILAKTALETQIEEVFNVVKTC